MCVLVVEDGDYEVRLRRWPEEIDKPINASIPAGAPVPGAKAFRTTPGAAISATKATVAIGDVKAETAVEPGAKEVVFQLKLKAGKQRMSALFHGEGGPHGAYFAYVRKK